MWGVAGAIAWPWTAIADVLSTAGSFGARVTIGGERSGLLLSLKAGPVGEVGAGGSDCVSELVEVVLLLGCALSALQHHFVPLVQLSWLVRFRFLPDPFCNAVIDWTGLHGCGELIGHDA